ncbi:MAG: 4-hydroxythreonine-4-phosphate dehydrogenase PdxA [Bacteroidota bacterium]
MKPTIAITIGDFNGIGPEVVLKSITSPKLKEKITPVLIGSIDLFSHFARKFKINISFTEVPDPAADVKRSEIRVINVHAATVKSLMPGKIAPDAGVCAGLALEKAISLCLHHDVDAMVTAPVSKEALHDAGYNFPGQTEMLALLTRSEKVTMMLMSKTMRVALVTVHIPIRNIAGSITADRILEKLETVHRSLQNDFGIASPSIAVLGLNPHAGENGGIGTEEKEIIAPAIHTANERKMNVSGPFAADGFFATYTPKKFDAILAMYHDQGLIPMKMTGFEEGVNFSAGLNIVRTSPDHGTAFDIAGKGIAHPGSMIAAIQSAISIVQQRKKHDRTTG